ncbi:MAG: RsmB/NOP family class I SAM-dependent RNA methyltransferase [Pseudomonadota bacterium]
MTPGARIAAAIEVLETINAGMAAEQALTRWARASRFAGSKDRAAVRDHVFDVLRAKQSVAYLGGGEAGRQQLVGLLRLHEVDINEVFNGTGHAPSPLTANERTAVADLVPEALPLDLPDWLLPELRRSLGDDLQDVAQLLRARAPATVRVNTRKASRAYAAERLLAEGIQTQENALSVNALTVLKGARGIRSSTALNEGLVELQDAASQAVVDLVPEGVRCLDFCAGGGGKALALAAQPQRQVWAHDSDMARMQDIAQRVRRAGCSIAQVKSADVQRCKRFDIVLCDVPCSGSGAWRRAPEGKWRLTQSRLDELRQIQLGILETTAPLVCTSGVLVYVTCSLLQCENEDVIRQFLDANKNWACPLQRQFKVSEEGDGFFTAHLTRVQDGSYATKASATNRS